MKALVLVGAIVAGLSAGVVHAQSGGHTAPKTQPGTAPAPDAPSGQLALGSVTIPKKVKANGETLAAGTYAVRLTTDTPAPNAAGQGQFERWVEFVQGGKVKGREVVTIIPQSEMKLVQKDSPPAANSSKFETLKGGDYARLWIRKGTAHYLIHFPS